MSETQLTTVTQNAPFFARMMSEDNSASSQRFGGLVVLGVGLLMAWFNMPAYREVLYVGATILGVKEIRKAVEGVGKNKLPATDKPATPTDPTKPIDTTPKPVDKPSA